MSTDRRRRPDERDVRIRPGRGSRPRTKDRPAHAGAAGGRVLTIDRGRLTVLVDVDVDVEADVEAEVGGEGRGAPAGGRVVTAMRARELGRSGIAVGDRVDVVGDTSGADGALARIVRIQPRASALRRTADDTDPVERVVVANADQLVVVAAVADPPPRARLVDRCLAAAFEAGLRPLLCLTKADLAGADGVARAAAPWADLDLAVVAVRRGADGALVGVGAVREQLAGRDSVLVGPSGVGKSTLVNALVPSAGRATGGVNAATGRGRHTSSSAVGLALPGGAGWVTDTPGVRSFGLAHLDPGRLVAAFADLVPGTQDCPRGCSHDEADCALDAWAASGGAGPGGLARLDSLRRLLRSRSGEDEATRR